MVIPSHPGLTTRAREVIALAHALADQRGDADLTPSHVALGLLEEGENVAVYVLSERGIPLDALAHDFRATLPTPGALRPVLTGRRWMPAADKFVAQGKREAHELDTPYYGAEHLLLALLREPMGAPARVLARYGVGFEDARADVRRVLGLSPDVFPQPPAG